MGTERLVELKKKYETRGSKEYMNLLKMVQNIYGSDLIPTLEEDAHGLISDASFVGYPGNVVFFTQKGQHTYGPVTKSALDLAYRLGYIRKKIKPIKPAFNYRAAVFTSNLTNIKVQKKRRAFKSEATAREIDMLNTGEGLSEKALFDFTISFEPNQTDFSAPKYYKEFEKIIRIANNSPGAVVMVRGHTSPAKVLAALVRSGLEKGIIKRTGTRGNYHYFYKGRELGLNDTKGVIALIESGAFDKPGDPNWDPKTIMAAALADSRKRAEAAVAAMQAYAKKKGLDFDRSQYQVAPVGMREPVIAKPTKANDKYNRRVEVLFVRVSSEAVNESDYDY
jgi:outer membrane protein OmpA-like peptidoglycan-associated protein